MDDDRGDLNAGWREQDADPGFLWRMLWRQIVPLILIPALCFAGGFAYIVFATPIYTASAFLEVQSDGAEGDALNAALTGHMASLTSEAVTSAVVDDLDLADDVPLGTGRLDAIVNRLRDDLGIAPLPEPTAEETRTIVLDRVAAGLSVERVGDSTILRVAYPALTPQAAAEITNAYVDTYIEALRSRSRDAMDERAAFLETRIDDVKTLASSSLEDVQRIRSEGLEQGAFENLDGRLARLTEARSALDELEVATRTRLELLNETDDPEGLERAALQVDRGADLFFAYRDALRRIESFDERGVDSSPLQGSAADLREELDRAIARERSGLELELAVLEARRNSLDEDLESALFESSRRNWSEILIGEHQANVFQNIYADYLRELEVVYGRAGAIPIRVMSYARPNVDPASPRYKLVLIVSIFLGLALALAVAMLREWQRAQRQARLVQAGRRP